MRLFLIWLGLTNGVLLCAATDPSPTRHVQRELTVIAEKLAGAMSDELTTLYQERTQKRERLYPRVQPVVIVSSNEKFLNVDWDKFMNFDVRISTAMVAEFMESSPGRMHTPSSIERGFSRIANVMASQLARRVSEMAEKVPYIDPKSLYIREPDLAALRLLDKAGYPSISGSSKPFTRTALSLKTNGLNLSDFFMPSKAEIRPRSWRRPGSSPCESMRPSFKPKPAPKILPHIFVR